MAGGNGSLPEMAAAVCKLLLPALWVPTRFVARLVRQRILIQRSFRRTVVANSSAPCALPNRYVTTRIGSDRLLGVASCWLAVLAAASRAPRLEQQAPLLVPQDKTPSSGLRVKAPVNFHFGFDSSKRRVVHSLVRTKQCAGQDDSFTVRSSRESTFG